MKKDPLIFLQHVLDSIGDIEQFSKGLSKKGFLTNNLIQSAIVRKVEVIGEAIKHVPFSFRKKYPEVEWKKIAGTRDKLIHQYFGIDFDLLWDIVKKELPKLKKQVKEIIEKEVV